MRRLAIVALWVLFVASTAVLAAAAYLLRCPRFWFLLPYGAAFGLVFVHRFAAGWGLIALLGRGSQPEPLSWLAKDTER